MAIFRYERHFFDRYFPDIYIKSSAQDIGKAVKLKEAVILTDNGAERQQDA